MAEAQEIGIDKFINEVDAIDYNVMEMTYNYRVIFGMKQVKYGQNIILGEHGDITFESC